MKVLRRISLAILMVLPLTFGITCTQSTPDESYIRGVGYAARGKFLEAKEQFEKALKIDPFFEEAESKLKTINDVTEQKLKKETAIHIFQGLNYLYTDYTNGEKDGIDQAISEYNKALEINPKYVLAYLERGWAYRLKDYYEEAMSDYNKAIEINPKYALAYRTRGNFYSLSLDYYDEAISDFTKAIEINPKYALAYSGRGYIYFEKLENKVKGCADLKKACELGKCERYDLAKQKGDCP